MRWTIIFLVALSLSVTSVRAESVVTDSANFQTEDATPASSKKPAKKAKTPTPTEDDQVLDAIREIRGEVQRASTRVQEVENITIDLASRVAAIERHQSDSLLKLAELEGRFAKRLEDIADLSTKVDSAHQTITSLEGKVEVMGTEVQRANQAARTALARAQAADAAARPKGIGKLIALLIPPLRHR